MAIQLRRGNYTDYDSSKMKNGEVAVVQAGDPATSDGKSAYMDINGTSKRLVFSDELINELNKKVDKETGKSIVAVDSELSTTSENPVQNKVVTGGLNSIINNLSTLSNAISALDNAKLEKTGDSQNNTVTFTSSDDVDTNITKDTSWLTVPKLTSGSTHKSLFESISQMFKNVRRNYKVLNALGTLVGNTNITGIGGGTVTGAISKLNTELDIYEDTLSGTTSATGSIRLGFGNRTIISARIMDDSNSQDYIILSVRALSTQWYFKVLHWDLTPVKNENVSIYYTYQIIRTPISQS